MTLNDIVQVLKKADSVLILPHISADGDCIGSSLALGMGLESLGKKVDIYLEEEVPQIYDFLPGKELIKVYPQSTRSFAAVVAIDTGDMGRLGKREVFFNSADVTVNIDHHNTNSMFGMYNYVDSSSSAAGEIIYKLLNTMEIDLNKDIATCLYVAITTDTGSFKFGSTTSATHRIASELLDWQVDVADISQKVFDAISLGKARLIGLAASSLQLFNNDRVSVISITDEIMKMAGAVEEDCDGIVNLGRNIDGVEVSILLRCKQDGEIKVNLRSKKYVDVSAIASRYSGGGHKRAAGCTIRGNMEDVKKSLLDSIGEMLGE